MFLRLLTAFIVIPLVELFLLLRLADATSVGATFAIVILTGILGSWLARREGAQAWSRFRLAIAEGRMPGREIQDGIMISVAAALLLTPGLLTDAVGFAFLFPVTREIVRKFLVQRYGSRFQVQMTGAGSTAGPNAGPDGPRRTSPPKDAFTVDATSVEHRSVE